MFDKPFSVHEVLRFGRFASSASPAEKPKDRTITTEQIAQSRQKFEKQREYNRTCSNRLLLSAGSIIEQSAELLLVRQSGGEQALFELCVLAGGIRGRTRPWLGWVAAETANEDALALSTLIRDTEAILRCYGRTRAVYRDGDRIKVHDMMEFHDFEGPELEVAYRKTKLWDEELQHWI